MQKITVWFTLAGPKWHPGIHICVPGITPRTFWKVTVCGGGLQLLQASLHRSIHTQLSHPPYVQVSSGYSKHSTVSKEKQVEKNMPEGTDAILQVPWLDLHLLSASGCVSAQQWVGWTYSHLSLLLFVTEKQSLRPNCKVCKWITPFKGNLC